VRVDDKSIHLLVTPEESDSAGNLMKRFGRRYVEMNPVRAGIIEHPGEYRGSGCQVNRSLQPDFGRTDTAHDDRRLIGIYFVLNERAGGD